MKLGMYQGAFVEFVGCQQQRIKEGSNLKQRNVIDLEQVSQLCSSSKQVVAIWISY